ncbi:unnamed protein product, partial [marine sediment metagenome]
MAKQNKLTVAEFKKLYEEQNRNIESLVNNLVEEQGTFGKIFDWQQKINNLV